LTLSGTYHGDERKWTFGGAAGNSRSYPEPVVAEAKKTSPRLTLWYFLASATQVISVFGPRNNLRTAKRHILGISAGTCRSLP